MMFHKTSFLIEYQLIKYNFNFQHEVLILEDDVKPIILLIYICSKHIKMFILK